MLEALKEQLKAVQDFDGPMIDAAIAIAEDMRAKVKAGMRRNRAERRARRDAMKLAGASNKEIREVVGKPKKRSGISIDADAAGREIILTASNQVQHLRRELGETPDLREVFRKYLPVAEEWRAKRGL